MRRLLIPFIAVLLAVPVSAQVVQPPSGAKIVSSDARLEKLHERNVDIMGGLTESPTLAPDGSIYFTDITPDDAKSYILRFDPQTGKTTVFTDMSGKANGIQFDSAGRLAACEGANYGGRCISRWDVKTKKKEVLADKYQGKRFNAPNDLDIDSQGRIYFSDPRYLGAEPRELEHRAVYRIDLDGNVSEITHDIEKPNGLALSLDEKTLYVADHNNGTDRIDPTQPAPKLGAMKIYAFPLDKNGLVAGKKKTLYDFGEQAGCDGMCLDEHGNLYLTQRSASSPGVLVIDGEGRKLAFIPTGPSQPGSRAPVGRPSNVCFGAGKDANVLYVTIDTGLYRIPLKVKGAVKSWK